MAGRPITNTSQRALRKREHMKRLREARKVRPVHFNPQPLAQAMRSFWSKQ